MTTDLKAGGRHAQWDPRLCRCPHDPGRITHPGGGREL